MKWTRALNVGAVTLLLAPLAAIAGPVDINSASAEKISEELKGVGLSKAEAIVEYREQHGRFESIEELQEVKGIGARTVEINREFILLESSGDEKN